MIRSLPLLALPAMALTAPAAALPAPAWVQESETETVSGRVTTFMEGTGIVIDRGSIDGLYTGDRVIFSVRGGQEQYGTIIAVEGRVSVVRPEDPEFKPKPGVSASITVPLARFEQDPVVPSAGNGAGAAGIGAGAAAGSIAGTGTNGAPGAADPDDKSKWTFADEDWSADMPLLAQVQAVLPPDRSKLITGRTYFSFNQIFDTEENRGDTFVRGGLALYADNPFGFGGRMHFDGEINYRNTQVPRAYKPGEDEATLRLDRLSYSIGGTRFTPTRWQFGRFLQNGMPELGILDGVEWSSRFESGDRFGVSLGYLPEPDADQDSFQDLQFAAWYRWVADLRETLAITTSYQKTWHNGADDRDLIISKLEYIPAEGWNVFANAWIDFYDGGDDPAKGDGPALTYAIFDVRKRINEKTGASIEYRHQEYPELLRDEFPPVGLPQLADARVDRIGLSAWRWIDGTADRRGKRLYGRVGGWNDEEDSGGDAELGIDIQGIFGDTGRLDVAGFASNGKFTEMVGGRIRYGRYGVGSSWSILLEARQNDIIGFEIDNDDFIQYRARWNYEFYKSSGLSMNISTDVLLQDTQDQVFVGLFIQRAF